MELNCETYRNTSRSLNNYQGSNNFQDLNYTFIMRCFCILLCYDRSTGKVWRLSLTANQRPGLSVRGVWKFSIWPTRGPPGLARCEVSHRPGREISHLGLPGPMRGSFCLIGHHCIINTHTNSLPHLLSRIILKSGLFMIMSYNAVSPFSRIWRWSSPSLLTRMIAG